MKLYLDDYRVPTDSYKRFKLDIYNTNIGWCIVRNFEQFCCIIEGCGLPEIISFDHDLSSEHMDFYFKNGEGLALQSVYLNQYPKFKTGTGWHCANFLVYYCKSKGLSLPKCFVHSANSTGSFLISEVLGL